MEDTYEAGYREAMARAGKATRWNSYAAGFKAGLEAAAKACEAINETEPALFAHNAHAGVGLAKMLCASAIRALSPSPSTTADTKTKALPRPEE